MEPTNRPEPISLAAWLYAVGLFACWVWLYATDGAAAVQYARTRYVGVALAVMVGLSFVVFWLPTRIPYCF
jgi:hypothetical protein